jgi:hypothetical protein
MTNAGWWLPVIVAFASGWVARSAIARWRTQEWRRETWGEARERAAAWSDE